MGFDLIALSHARPVACPGGDTCPGNHYRVGSFRRGGDVVKAGCYVLGKGGRSFHHRVGSYLVYNIWRRHLSLLMESRLVRSLGGTIATGPFDDLRWMKDPYFNFCQALHTASRGGFVVFS